MTPYLRQEIINQISTNLYRLAQVSTNPRRAARTRADPHRLVRVLFLECTISPM